MNNITTIGALKASGYIYKSIKDEIRSNLIKKLQNKEKAFKGIEDNGQSAYDYSDGDAY